MSFPKSLLSKKVDDESSIPTPISQVKWIRPIVVNAVETLFSNSVYRTEIFESLLKNGKRHSTRNILVFIYQCTYPLEEQSSGEQEIITLEQYLEKQEKNLPSQEIATKRRSVTEQQAKNELLKYLALDSTGVYYFVRDLADYPGASDMEWITKIENRKRELLMDGTF